MKKKVLIGLFGLSRTFKYTSKFLFERIINPNSNDYDFDIIINTDFENGSLTYRGEDGSSTAKYKYNDIELFKKDLNDYYNVHNNLKDIIIYNKETNFIVFPWFLVYKRIQQILQKSFQNNDIYDIYIMMRMDIIVDNIITLNETNNEIVFISGDKVRNAYLHNRDLDFMFYGNYLPIMLWVHNTINLFQDIMNKNDESKHFFDNENICSNELLFEFDKLKKDIYFDQNYDINKIVNQIMIHHTPNSEIIDTYNLNNKIVSFDLNKYYDLESDFLFKYILYNIKIILHSYNFYLSENKNKIHASIIR